MASLIKSVKAFGEKATGQKINGNTLVGVMKDMGQKMTGKEIKGNSLLDIIDATTKDYTGGGGTKVVTELPEVGDEHTVYELHETKVADFPWLFTEMDTEREYPSSSRPIIVVDKEEDVTFENLRMEYTKGGRKGAILVYVKATNKLYNCKREATESGPDAFIKDEIIPVNNVYLENLAILQDFDYHITKAQPGEEYHDPILDGTGHFLDGTEFDYTQYEDVIPLVLTDATNKQFLLGNYLIGQEEFTSETQVKHPVQVNKIDLSIATIIIDEGGEPVFAPQPSKTISTYWIYANNNWFNVDEIGDLNTITIPVTSTDGDAGLIPLNKIHFYLNNKELDLVTVQSLNPDNEEVGYLVLPLPDSFDTAYPLHIVFDSDIIIGGDCVLYNPSFFVVVEDDPHIQITSSTREYDFNIRAGGLSLINGNTK